MRIEGDHRTPRPVYPELADPLYLIPPHRQDVQFPSSLGDPRVIVCQAASSVFVDGGGT